MRSLRIALLALFALPLPAHASVIVTVVPAAASVAVGGTLEVELVAEFNDPDRVLAWGLDLVLDAPLVAPLGAPELGPGWIGFATPDGDGLGGVALSGVTGTHLLARLVLEGLAPGVVQLGLAMTTTPVRLRDPTEGFALYPEGFASDVSFVGASLLVVPEPACGWLLAAGALLWQSVRRRASGGPQLRGSRLRWSARSSSSTIGARPRA